MKRIVLNTQSTADYSRFLKIKSLPQYGFQGRTGLVPDEYAESLGIEIDEQEDCNYTPSPFLFDYQRDIVNLAISKKAFSVFADCGLGKTLMFLEFAKHLSRILPADRAILIISPLMVIPQTLAEAERWYNGSLPIEQIRSRNLASWLLSGSRIGIANYEALNDSPPRGRLGALILDESSMLKSHYGKWAGACLQLGRGLKWKMACTGTPAPNDRIEYANHAVFMGAFPTVNSFLARYFINRGKTGERWDLKAHAKGPFYHALSHWSIFLQNPKTYGWHDNTQQLPPIEVQLHTVPLTREQIKLAQDETGHLLTLGSQTGGIASRLLLSQIAKGNLHGRRIKTNKPGYIRQLIESWPDESTIVWCRYNAEQELISRELPRAGSIDGSTPYDKRHELVEAFKAGTLRTLISKPKILGFGLNLHIATRQVFSGLQDSYEEYYQAVKRSNRFGSKSALHVHIPMTDIEWPMINTVLHKARMVDRDTREQEAIFKEYRYGHYAR